GEGEFGGGDGQLNIARHELQVLRERLLVLGQCQGTWVEVADLSRGLTREPVDLKGLEWTDAPSPLRQRGPDDLRGVSQGSDESESGDYDATLGGSHGHTHGLRGTFGGGPIRPRLQAGWRSVQVAGSVPREGSSLGW